MKKREVLKFNNICKNIKSIKIQGARNVAKAGLEAYLMIPTKNSKKKLLSLRPTEPMLERVLDLAEKQKPETIINHFDEAQKKINKNIFKIIKNGNIILTHCHSTNVVNALIYSKKNKKSFEVYNTETRPLFQGRKTALELKKANIKTTMFVDSAMLIAIKGNGTKKVDKIIIGADALIEKGIINKIGSGILAELAKEYKIPFYIVADSWKYSSKSIPIENRTLNEVWDKAPKNFKIRNPAFEFVNKKYITKIITELGIFNYDDFLKERKINF
jgi:translation initiation factor 2B subunit (eIF-2B alpha/beta/delta family)